MRGGGVSFVDKMGRFVGVDLDGAEECSNFVSQFLISRFNSVISCESIFPYYNLPGSDD